MPHGTRVRASGQAPCRFRTGVALSLAALVIAAAWGTLAAPGLAPTTRPAPPSDAAQEASRKRIKERHAAEYAKAEAGARRMLGDKLFESARDAMKSAPDAPDEARVEQFTMLGEARDLAIAARDADLAVKAIDLRARLYAIDSVAEKARALGEAGPPAKSRPASQTHAAQWLRLAEEAAAVGKFDAAHAASERALVAARQFNDKPLTELVAQRVDALRAARTAAERYQQAAAVLAREPADPQANLVVGLYLCSRKGDWEKALPALAQGADATTRQAAKRDLAAAGNDRASAGERINVGDLWRVLAKSQPEDQREVREAFARRARFWFETALPLVAEEDRPAVLKRIEALPAAMDFPAVAKSAAAGTARTPAAGATGGGEFEAAPGDGAVLVGFHTTFVQYNGRDVVASLSPVFAAPGGSLVGTVSGTPRNVPRPVVAKQGYAVGGVVVASDDRMNGFEVLFMRLKGTKLDPADSYKSEWLGTTGGERKSIDTGGRPAVGIHGRRGVEVAAVGLIHLK